MEKDQQIHNKHTSIRSSELGSKSPTNFSIPRYADKLKDMMEKSSQSRKIVQIQPQSPPHKPTKDYFFFRVKSIGVGAHSFVYLVQQQQTKMLLSQKSITKQHASQIQQDLLRQIKLLSHLNHNNIIKLYHFYSNQTHINLITQFAQDSLFNLKQKFTIFKQKQIIQVIKQLLHALQYLHQHHIVHADIKLQNIMIANVTNNNIQGTIKLIDFGLAHRLKQKQMKKQVQGTMEYLPPQYAQGHDSGFHRDIWAIGILAFQMSVGKHPFDGMKQNQKWAKLVKTPPQSYFQQLQYIQNRQLGINSQKVLQLVKGIFQPEQRRWSAQKLLQLPFFNPQ